MKKSVAIIAGIVVIGGGAWLGGAWYTGTQLETKSAEYVARFNAEVAKSAPGLGVALRQESFDRGIFRSQSRYLLVIEESPDDTLTLTFDTRYEHGPFPIGALANGEFAPRMAVAHSQLARTPDVEPWFQATGDQTPFWLDTIVSYGGDAEFKGAFAAATAKADGDDQPMLEFSGADLHGSYARDAQQLVGLFDVPNLKLQETHDEQFAVQLAGTQLEFDLKEGNFGMQKGKVELRMDRFSMEGDLREEPWDVDPASPSAPNRFSVDKLVYGGVSDEDSQFIKGEIYLRGESVTLDEHALGQQSLNVTFDRIDGQAFNQIMTAADKLSTASPYDNTHFDEFNLVVADSGAKLLGANPTLAIDPFVWKTDKGESRLSIRTTFAQPENMNVPPSFILLQALKTLNVDLDLHKPMAVDLVATQLQLEEDLDAETASAVAQEAFDAQIAQIVELGFAKEDGDNVVTNLQFDGEKLTVNDRDIPMAELMGMMMAF